MKPLRVCFLWHQHQPYYRKGDYFILPWVRFHAVKDYLDLALLLDEFPGMKQTFNIVPSLLLQLNQYISEGVLDRVQVLSAKEPNELTESEKEEILRQFFVCNFQNMVNPYPRYLELYHKAQNKDKFSEQDWLDLQVWYNLTWLGPITRNLTFFRRLFQKGSGFTRKERDTLLSLHLDVIREIVPTLKRLVEFEQIELSVSPFYHPILPLLCDVDIVKVGLPGLYIPEPKFRFPQDAQMQISKGKQYFSENIGFEPYGLWPSEGSLSTEVLDLIADSGFHWTATDSKLLLNSLGSDNTLLQYFPYSYSKNGKNLILFFRDSRLSDAIGFTYHRWGIHDAVEDFLSQLKLIRSALVEKFGEDSLEQACVPIILDGENCWEFYPENGLPFLKELYTRLLNENLFVTTTFEEIVKSIPPDNKFRLESIYPGSWINANFCTWIGQPTKQVAWNWLARARTSIENHKSNEEVYKQAMELALIAEGSDWFWWYGDDNIAPNKSDFDELFRWYLQEIYRTLGQAPPDELLNPLSENIATPQLITSSRRLTENSLNILSNELGWGCFNARSTSGTMQTSGAFLSDVFFGNTRELFAVGLRFSKSLSQDDKVKIYFIKPVEFVCEITSNELRINSAEAKKFTRIYFRFTTEMLFGIGLDSLFGKKGDYTGSIVEFFVKTTNETGEIDYPFDGTIIHVVV